MPEVMPYPLHPMLVHFPIALFLSAFFFELGGIIFKKEQLRKTALILYVSATLIAPLVYWTGLEEARNIGLLGRHPVINKHQLFATITTWTSLASLPVLFIVQERNSKAFTITFLFFLATITVSVILTGHFGGRMVYEYGAGVE